ncbi:hypothetical protein PIIN_10500 [Serendipita indica DSM 11827]|uniref:Uncharacterized protein n=1 Tax=Serendipita indica (strain DSM 11827) TaxID=1109443 RepID=G4TYW4_SERID|nr:hypothetical protein PIIN_10500 [Serendipita indica DSM 11827]
MYTGGISSVRCQDVRSLFPVNSGETITWRSTDNGQKKWFGLRMGGMHCAAHDSHRDNQPHRVASAHSFGSSTDDRIIVPNDVASSETSMLDSVGHKEGVLFLTLQPPARSSHKTVNGLIATGIAR